MSTIEPPDLWQVQELGLRRQRAGDKALQDDGPHQEPAAPRAWHHTSVDSSLRLSCPSCSQPPRALLGGAEDTATVS